MFSFAVLTFEQAGDRTASISFAYPSAAMIAAQVMPASWASVSGTGVGLVVAVGVFEVTTGLGVADGGAEEEVAGPQAARVAAEMSAKGKMIRMPGKTRRWS